MKITLNPRESDLGKQSLQFLFELEGDDRVSGKSSNLGGGAEIQLRARNANFHFPIEFAVPHPDLAAISALKIVSPFIGSRLIMDRPVSLKAAAIIKKTYPWITEIATDDRISPRPVPLEKPAISFSGGADSVAVASVMPVDTPLIMAARTYHPEIGEFEPWTKAAGPVGTMDAMPNDARKYLVLTDFMYLSTNNSYCIYPDTYSFTSPALLLADHLGLSHIVTGDIIAGLTGNETIFNPVLMPTNLRGIFRAAGLDIECPCNGVSEIVTSKIVHAAGLTEASSTCEYGGFGNPCMRCIKCLRKNMYLWAITGDPLTDEQIERFNNADRIKSFANAEGRSGLAVMPSFKWAFRRIGRHFSGAIGEIQHRAYSCDIPVLWADKHYPPVYRDRPSFVLKAFQKIKEVAPAMTTQDMQDFSRLDWRKNYQ